MNKEIISSETGKLDITILIPLTQKEEEKMECPELAKRITNLAKDMHVNYAIRISDNKKLAEISFVHQGKLDHEDELSYEKKALEFVSTVDTLEIPEPECPNHEQDINEEADAINKNLKNAEAILEDIERLHFIIAVETIPHILHQVGVIPVSEMKEMLEMYIQKYK